MGKQLSFLPESSSSPKQQGQQQPYPQPKSSTVTIRDLPSSERPRARLERLGPGALSTVELLAIILGTGVEGESALDVAARLVARYEGLAGLARAGFSELAAERGLGPAKVSQLQAALELGRRMALAAPEDDRPVLCTSADAAALLIHEMSYLEQEHLYVLFLNSRYRVIGQQVLYKGNLTLTQVRIGEVFREAIRRNCASILVAHNHPSGDPTPSPDDIALTRKLVEAGHLVGIEVVDHLVIAALRWVSMRDRRLGFE
jgi:DNA repair protein RadC